MESTDWVRRVIHFICGAVVGAVAAVLFIAHWTSDGYELPSLLIILGASLVTGVLAAAFLDAFWEWCRDIWEWLPW